MTNKKTRLQIVSRRSGLAASEAGSAGPTHAGPPLVSGRWLLSAVGLVVAAAALCVWCALCLLFWQGNWQLLYHPAAAIVRTPASLEVPFDQVGFAATDAGVPRLTGWWIPAASGAPFSRITVLYSHGQNGNLGDTVDALARLHKVGVNVLAFDYRGYGQSQFARPSEARWRQDAGWALQYLTQTRHIDSGTIVLDGAGLGANLALEVAAEHPELAGVVLESPLEAPMSTIFYDARARMVPAHLLDRDRYDLNAPAAALHIPILWFVPTARPGQVLAPVEPEAFKRVAAHKMLVWLSATGDADKQYADAISRWLDDLPVR